MKALISLSPLVVGLGLGSLAPPKEIARVGFYGVAMQPDFITEPGEGEPMQPSFITVPGEGEPRATIRVSQIDNLISRMLLHSDGIESQVDTDHMPLPCGNVLDPPDVGILIFVDGVPQDGSARMPFLSGILKSTSSLGVIRDVVDGRESNSNVLANAMGVRSSLSPHACLELKGNVEGPNMSLDSTIACSKVLSISGGIQNQRAFLERMGWTYELSDVNIMPISESIKLMDGLPRVVDKICYGYEPQKAIVVHLTFPALPDLPIEERSKLELAFDMVIENQVMLQSNCLPQKQIIVQFVVGPNLSRNTEEYTQVERQTSLFLEGNNRTTLDDIVQYQLNLWTAVGLIITVLAAIGIIALIDIGRDSLLYAKISMNTQGLKDD